MLTSVITRLITGDTHRRHRALFAGPGSLRNSSPTCNAMSSSRGWRGRIGRGDRCSVSDRQTAMCLLARSSDRQPPLNGWSAIGADAAAVLTTDGCWRLPRRQGDGDVQGRRSVEAIVRAAAQTPSSGPSRGPKSLSESSPGTLAVASAWVVALRHEGRVGALVRGHPERRSHPCRVCLPAVSPAHVLASVRRGRHRDRAPGLVAILAPLNEQARGMLFWLGLVWGILLIAVSRLVLFHGGGWDPGPGDEDGEGPCPGDGRPTPPAPIGGVPLPDAEPSSTRVRDHRPTRRASRPRRPIRERERLRSRLWPLRLWPSWRPS
jgi:hypothetical protein